MESFREFGFLMQIKASEYERNEKKKKKKNEMILVVFVD